MADAFTPQLSSDIRFNQPVETPSVLGGLAELGSLFAGAYIDRRNERAKEERAIAGQQPTTNPYLAFYTDELRNLQDQKNSGGISDAQFRIRVGQLNTSYAAQGIDVSSAEFDVVRESVTGLPSAMSYMTNDQLAFSKYLESTEGQTKIALATATLTEELGRNPTQEEIVRSIQSDDALKVQLDNLNIRSEVDYRAQEPFLRQYVSSLGNSFKTSLSIIEQNGLRIDDPQMLQNSYLSYQNEKAAIISKIPSFTGREQAIKELFQVTDTFFEGLGFKEGSFQVQPSGSLDIKRKAIIAVELLGKRPDQASAILAQGIMNNNYNMTEDQYNVVLSLLGEEAFVPSTPEWITDAGIVITNDMISVAAQLESVGADFMRTSEGATQALKDVMGADVFAKWEGLTAEQAWTNAFGRAGILKGYNVNDIRNGTADTTAVYNILGGVAAGMGVIDFTEEAVSFGGVRQAVSSNLPSIVAALEQSDPEKGKAARTMLWLATGQSARQYEAQVQASENSMEIAFNPSTRTYNIDLTKVAPGDEEKVWAAGVVSKRYGGNLLRAIEDRFSLVQPEDSFKGEQVATGEIRNQIDSIFGQDVDELKRVLDLRNSVVYLDGLSRQLEPENARVAREIMAEQNLNKVNQADILSAQTMETLATTPRPGEIVTSTVPSSGPVTTETPVTYFDVNDQNLPSGGAIVEVGSARVAANSVMQPLLNTTAGASRMLKEGADTRMAGLLQGPFQALQSSFGKPLVINDGLAKDGTSRESETPNSRHFHGDALDISTAGMTDAEKLKLVDDAIAAGFQGFGFGNNILHIDLGAKRAWAYGNETFGGVPVSELKARVQGSTVAPAAVRMDPRVSQPSAGGVLTTPEVDDREGAPTGFTVFSGVAPVATAGTAAETAPATDAGTAALPEAITPSQPMPQITEQGVQNTPVIDREVRAFISEIAANPDRSYTTDAEFLAAQQRGELEPGDTVVVDGVAYVIRKDGTARRLGQIEQQQQ